MTTPAVLKRRGATSARVGIFVLAGLDRPSTCFGRGQEDVDTRDKRGHDAYIENLLFGERQKER
jgi:hypothetical protein